MNKFIIGAAAAVLAALALPAPALAQFGGDPNAQVDYPGDPSAADAGTRARPDDAATADDQYDDEDGQYAPDDEGWIDDEGAPVDGKPDAGTYPDEAYPDDAYPYDGDDGLVEGAPPGNAPAYGDKPDPDASVPPKMNPA